MEFFKTTVSDKARVTIAYSPASISPAILEHCCNVITLLCRGVAGAQRDPGVDEKHIDAALQSLVGFAALSIGEAAAILALVSIGFERQSRVHLRALHEYLARTDLLLGDPEKAYEFKIAAAAEADRFSAMMPGRFPPDQLRDAKTRFLSDVEAEIPKKEKAVIGDMRTVMDTLRPGSYAADFAFLSLVSHGSILALNEMSAALAQTETDITRKVGFDRQGGLYLFEMCTAVLQICCHLIRELKVDIAKDLDWLCERNVALAKEYGVAENAPIADQVGHPHEAGSDKEPTQHADA